LPSSSSPLSPEPLLLIISLTITMGGSNAGVNVSAAHEMSDGASEKDIVYSGLEETMTQAVGETFRTAEKYKVSYRVAGFINALKSIETAYRDAGITIS